MWRGCSSTAASNSSTEAAKGGGGVVLLRWAIYISLLLLRFIGIDQRGYVHPDEFYQGGQELFFGRWRSDGGAGAGISCTSSSSSSTSSSTPRGDEYMVTNNSVPWEYQPIHAVRSIVPPVFMTLVPIHIYAAMMQRYYYYYSYDYCVATMNDDKDVDTSFSSTAAKGQCTMNSNNNYHGHNNEQLLSGKEILLIPRLFMTILSIIFLDGSLWLLVSYRDQQQQYHTATTTTTKTKTMRMTKQQQQQQQQTIAILLPSPPIEVIILASSWPCLVLSTRPFTNSLETMCVAVLIVIIVRTLHNNTTTTLTTTTPHDSTSYYYSILPLILIGITCSIGIFIRFTFAFFALPSVIIFLYHRWKKRKLISNNKSSSNRLLVGGRGYDRLVQSLLLLLQHVLHDGIWIIVSFALVSYIFIYIDTQYYYTSSSSSQVNSFLNWNEEDANDDNNTARNIFSCPSSSSQSQQQQQQQEGIYPKSMLNYITPMNALLYNSKQDNLALHGLHSRITHIAINMPLLFGPLTIIGLVYLLQNLVGRIIKRSNNTQLSHISSSSNSTEDNSVKELICQWTIISGVIILSCAPHQEPRFLLPAMVPLVYLHGRQLVVGIDVNNTDPSITNKRRSMNLRHNIPLVIWIVFNTIVYIFFGQLHQGGLLDSLLHLNDYSSIHDERDITSTNATLPRVFVYYKTYMPPTFLTRAGDDDWTHAKSVNETKKCDVAESGKCDQSSSSSTRQRKVIILDLKGANSSVLLEVLHEWLPCHGPNMSVKESNSNHFIQLISIPAAILPLAKKSNGSSAVLFDEYTIATITSYDNHISTEDWPAFEGSIASFINQLRLDVYLITCGTNKMHCRKTLF